MWYFQVYKLLTEPNLKSNLWKVQQSVEFGSALLGQKMQTPKIKDCPCIAGAPRKHPSLETLYVASSTLHPYIFLPLFKVILFWPAKRYSQLRRKIILSQLFHLLPTPNYVAWSVQFSCSVVSNSLWPHAAARQASLCITNSRSSLKLMSTESVMPCNHLIFCHPLLLQSSIQMSQFFALGGQSIGVSTSASVLPMNIQDWSPLRWSGWNSLQSKGLSRVFSNTTVQKHQFFNTQLSL